MPLYEYLCEHCGPFTETRPMTEYRSPAYCPFCDSEAPRAILSAPAMASVSSEIRHAHGVNERAAHAPKTSVELREAMRETKKSYGAGCACCSGSGKPSSAVKTKDGAVGFPTRRPWMISH